MRTFRSRKSATWSERPCRRSRRGFAARWNGCGRNGKEARMASDQHERARVLAAESRIDGISPQDSLWLRRHIAECCGCARYAESLEGVVRGLRSFAFE